MRPFEPKTKSPHQNLLKASKFVRNLYLKIVYTRYSSIDNAAKKLLLCAKNYPI